MSTRPPKVPWPREPHTAAKHEIYRLYLSRWYPILIRGFSGNVTYAEGFAGPGVYEGGHPGSPVIAITTLFKDASLRSRVRRVRLLFVDADPRCIRLLDQELGSHIPGHVPFPTLRDRYNVDIQTRQGDCEPTLEQLLGDAGAWGHPMLVVLDTFGGAVSARLLHRIAANPASEVIVTIQPQYFTRFAEAGDISKGDEVFGNDTWRLAAQQPSNIKARWLLQHYRQTVREAGFTHVLDFELIDTNGQALYLVFGTTHDLGLRKMKEVMWEVDDIAGVRYRDPRDPGQETLAIEVEPQTAPLRRLLRDYLRTLTGTQATVQDLRRFALYNTVFKESQVQPALQKMADSAVLTSDAQDGVVRLRSTVRLRP